ncbi:hypothetical protein L6452_05200 [Arctium lappa]|uniref:Uncharacterized protein n=1 Tax=Arctium lappa TaxID=4217 RepID=A0ACB9EFR0_ARCLA|nr:hypothetical protein L6452_05200 [Arctium lappa]
MVCTWFFWEIVYFSINQNPRSSLKIRLSSGASFDASSGALSSAIWRPPCYLASLPEMEKKLQIDVASPPGNGEKLQI